MGSEKLGSWDVFSDRFPGGVSFPKGPSAAFMVWLVCEWQCGEIAHLIN